MLPGYLPSGGSGLTGSLIKKNTRRFTTKICWAQKYGNKHWDRLLLLGKAKISYFSTWKTTELWTICSENMIIEPMFGNCSLALWPAEFVFLITQLHRCIAEALTVLSSDRWILESYRLSKWPQWPRTMKNILVDCLIEREAVTIINQHVTLMMVMMVPPLQSPSKEDEEGCGLILAEQDEMIWHPSAKAIENISNKKGGLLEKGQTVNTPSKSRMKTWPLAHV